MVVGRLQGSGITAVDVSDISMIIMNPQCSKYLQIPGVFVRLGFCTKKNGIAPNRKMKKNNKISHVFCLRLPGSM